MIRRIRHYLAYLRFKMLQRRSKRKAREADPNIYPMW
jgi:hypothetical protein